MVSGQKTVTGKPKTPGKIVSEALLPKGMWACYKQKVRRDFVWTETANVHYGLVARWKVTRT